jgi:hypothetical protein
LLWAILRWGRIEEGRRENMGGRENARSNNENGNMAKKKLNLLSK